VPCNFYTNNNTTKPTTNKHLNIIILFQLNRRCKNVVRGLH